MWGQRGVTLAELMVVVVTCGLLAAIAVPTYQSSIERARVATAVGDILWIGHQIERSRTRTFTLPESLADLNLDRIVDPWGQPYRYLRIATAKTGEVRRDRNLRPINSDYDLYSTGRDRVTQTQLQGRMARDDVVRANNGEFVGLAKDY